MLPLLTYFFIQLHNNISQQLSSDTTFSQTYFKLVISIFKKVHGLKLELIAEHIKGLDGEVNFQKFQPFLISFIHCTFS